MGSESISELLGLINKNIHYQESLEVSIYKAYALSEIALSHDLLEWNKDNAYYYLWLLNDLINDVKMKQENFLSGLHQAHQSLIKMVEIYG